MQFDWLPSALVPAVIVLVLALFRRMAPSRSRTADRQYEDRLYEDRRYDDYQAPEPLPTGLISGTMWTLGLAFGLTFFLLRGANHRWAAADGPAILTLYDTPWLWFFFPFFAALTLPWPLTVWYLRKVGRRDEADNICDNADLRGGMDSFKVMKWLGIVLVGPIAVATLLAIPIHLSIGLSEARLGHYAALHSERFSFREATRATLVDGYRLRDGSFRRSRDVVIDFSDGRRLHGNAVEDDGTDVQESVVQLLLARTGLHPSHVQTMEDIPPK